MEASLALQRCTRHVIQNSNSTRRSIPTLSSHTVSLRPKTPESHNRISRQPFSSTTAQKAGENGRQSLQELLRDFKKDLRAGTPANERLDSLMGRSTPNNYRRPSPLDAFNDTLGPLSSSGTNPPRDSDLSLSSFVASLNQEQLDPYADVNLRLKPSLGRTVKVVSGDPSRAFRLLERRCIDNNLKRDEISQRFHIRRGQLKKILRVNRWRTTFQEGFIAECGKIRRMRKQGW